MPLLSTGVTRAGPSLSAWANALMRRPASSDAIRVGWLNIVSRSRECFAERVDADTQRQLRLVEIADELADAMIVLCVFVDPLGIVDIDVMRRVRLRIDHAMQRPGRGAVKADDEPLALGNRADENCQFEIGLRDERGDQFEPECGD